jgi:hypothetical protein
VSEFHKLPIRYPARYDYGSRRGYPTKALVFHMAEGTNDPDGFYGVKHARHALGKWWSNPNVALVSVEVDLRPAIHC